MFESFGKSLIFIGVIIVILGILLLLFEKLPFNLGKLPGDVVIKRDNFTFYFPLTTSILISVILTIILTIIARLSK
ncbi:MAG: DUF2905 domain-containing protein [Hydrogenothermaceae bacterium]|nr:DUF2905 domain-containing protein [Hydrogenothermaceae bacterium]